MSFFPLNLDSDKDAHFYLIASHAYWKERLFNAIENKEKIDINIISKNNLCDLGKWLSDSHPHIGHLQSYHDLAEKHTKFHVESSKVAEQINAKKYDDALRLMDESSAFERASTEVIEVIFQLKKDVDAQSLAEKNKEKQTAQPS
ncbi:MAG: CZB domain-containing protein [Methylococcaceae bacterium]